MVRRNRIRHNSHRIWIDQAYFYASSRRNEKLEYLNNQIQKPMMMMGPLPIISTERMELSLAWAEFRRKDSIHSLFSLPLLIVRNQIYPQEMKEKNLESS